MTGVKKKKSFFQYYVPKPATYFIKNPQIHNFLFYGKMLTQAFLYQENTNSASNPNSCHSSPSSKSTYNE